MDIHVLAWFTGHPVLLPGHPLALAVVLLYFGPETMMPVGSLLAALLGLFLLFWRQTVSLARNGLRRVLVRRPGYTRFGRGGGGGTRGQDEATDRRV